MAGTPTPTPALTAAQKTILVVDDEKNIRRALQLVKARLLGGVVLGQTRKISDQVGSPSGCGFVGADEFVSSGE